MQRIALVVLLCCGCGEPRPSAVWVLDGGAGIVARLDEELRVVAHEPRAAARLLAADASATWLGEDVEGRVARLLRVETEYGESRALSFRGLVALVSDGEGGVYALDGAAEARCRLWHVEPWMGQRFLGEFSAATALAGDGRELLLGTGAGELLSLRRDGAVLARGVVRGRVHALVAGGVPGTWFVLAGAEAMRLTRRGAELEPSWTVGLSGACSGLAVDSRSGALWLVEEETLVRLAAGGARELALALPCRGGPWRAFAARGGRAWLAGTGALLVVDSSATRAWLTHAQGGFDEIVAAVSPAGAAMPPPAASSRRALPPRSAQASW